MKHQKEKYIFFLNSAHIMLKLNGMDRVLLDFICERMSQDNRISIDQDFRRRFIDFVGFVSHNQTTVKEAQVKGSINKLTSENILFRESRGLYIVNPKHFTKETLKQNREHFNDLQAHLESTTSDKTLLRTPRNGK